MLAQLPLPARVARAARSGRHRTRQLARPDAGQPRRLPLHRHPAPGCADPLPSHVRGSEPALLRPPAGPPTACAARGRVHPRTGAPARRLPGRRGGPTTSRISPCRCRTRSRLRPSPAARPTYALAAPPRRLPAGTRRVEGPASPLDARLRGRVHHRALLGLHTPTRRRHHRIRGGAPAVARLDRPARPPSRATPRRSTARTSRRCCASRRSRPSSPWARRSRCTQGGESRHRHSR